MLVLLDLSLDKHHLPFSLSLSSSLYIFISGFVAHPKLPWISDISVYWWLRRVFSLATLLLYHSIDYDSILALVFMYCISCFISFIALCYAWPTLRGRWTCWTLDHCFYITTWHYFRPVSMCYHLSYVYHLATVLSSNHLPCHYLARPFYYVMTYLTTIHSWYAWLFTKYHHSVMLSLDTQHDDLTCDYHLYGDLDLWFCVMISDLFSCFTCSDLTI